MDRYNYRKMFLAILPISRYSQQVSTNIINLKIKSFRRAAKEVRGQCHQLKRFAIISWAINRTDTYCFEILAAFECSQVYRCCCKSLPPRGRGTALAVEGACVTLSLAELQCDALSIVSFTDLVSFADSSLPIPTLREPLDIVRLSFFCKYIDASVKAPSETISSI